jgi:hypothetical protein
VADEIPWRACSIFSLCLKNADSGSSAEMKAFRFKNDPKEFSQLIQFVVVLGLFDQVFPSGRQLHFVGHHLLGCIVTGQKKVLFTGAAGHGDI